MKAMGCGGCGSKPSEGPSMSWEYATRVKHNPAYAVVVAGGSKTESDLRVVERASLVVAADSGAEFLRQHKLVPDIVVGDFDSCHPDTVARFRDLGVPVVCLERDKDKTDTEVALDLIAGKGFDTAIIIGGTRGRRLDHELANVFLIEHYARKGMDVIIHSQDSVIFGVSGDEGGPAIRRRVFAGNPGDWVTIMPITSRVTGAVSSNLKFPLKDDVLYRGSTLGVSNEMLDSIASIAITSGFALVLLHPR